MVGGEVVVREGVWVLGKRMASEVMVLDPDEGEAWEGGGEGAFWGVVLRSGRLLISGVGTRVWGGDGERARCSWRR